MPGRNGMRGADLSSFLHAAVAKAASSASAHDALTGLPNRALSNAILDAACEAGDHEGIALLRLCIDDVTELRNEHGQATADTLLAAVAGRLRRSIRAGDVAAKVRDADFSLILAADDVAEAACAAQRVLERLREPYEVSGILIDVTVSIGIAFATPGSATGAQVLERAEIALERARSTGRGEWKIYKPGNGVDPDTQAAMVADLQAALANQEMSVALHPMVHLDDLCVFGADAILQWDHPKIGRIASTDFLPVLKDPQAARLLADWLIGGVCETASRHGIRVVMALDATVEPDDQFAERIAVAIVESGVAEGLVWIGIPEATFAGLGEPSIRALGRIRALGVKIVLDDLSYGTLGVDMLRALPIDAIRTGPSVIEALETDIHAFAWIQGLTGLAVSMGIPVGARGVETDAELDTVSQFGFNFAQGGLLGGAMTTTELAAFKTSRAPLTKRRAAEF